VDALEVVLYLSVGRFVLALVAVMLAGWALLRTYRFDGARHNSRFLGIESALRDVHGRIDSFNNSIKGLKSGISRQRRDNAPESGNGESFAVTGDDVYEQIEKRFNIGRNGG